MKTEEGGRRFINLRTGDEVEIRFRRDGSERRGTLIAGKVLDDGR